MGDAVRGVEDMSKHDIKPILPEKLFVYACKFANKMGKPPTFRQVAKRFNCTYDQIEDACADWDNKNGYMEPALAVAAMGGFFAIEHRGDYLVEAYKYQD